MRHLRLPFAIFAIMAIAACGSGKSSSNGGSNGASNAGSSSGSSMGSQGRQAAGNMPNCGAVQPVWVNLRTKKYHEQGDPAYGHTRQGEYLCPAQAEQQGFTRAGGGGRRHHGHHRNRSESGGYQSGGNQSDTGDNQNDNSDATSNP